MRSHRLIFKLNGFKHWLIAWLAYWWYGRPAKKLIVIGVTGTKGKSSSCRFIASVLEAGGYKVGMLTTVEFQIDKKRWLNDKKMTMLGRGQIQNMLRQMVEAGCRYAVVETSSEGILQYRHFGLHYDIAVFTNLGSEHSERHGGFENLRRDKGRLFAGLEQSRRKIFNDKKVKKVSVLNTDDAQAKYFLEFQADEKIGYGLHLLDSASLSSSVVATIVGDCRFVVGGHDYEIKLPGRFNIYNALAAIAVGQSQNIPAEQIASGLASVSNIPGRMEFVEAGQDFKLVVDYAHEPMSLTALFETLRPMVGVGGRLMGIIGSDGGGRDKGKRSKMGEIAGKLCDVVIITDVNCFDENPLEIAEMLAAGARGAGKSDGENLFIEVDRRKAIEFAVSKAKTGDAIVLTAKGTEPCICVAHGQRIPWDDREEARKALGKVLGSDSYNL